MTRVLDTRALPLADGAQAYATILSPPEDPLQFDFGPSAAPFSATVDLSDMESGFRLIRIADSGSRMVRGHGELRERMTIFVKSGGHGAFTLGRDSRSLSPGDLVVNDHTSTAEALSLSHGDGDVRVG